MAAQPAAGHPSPNAKPESITNPADLLVLLGRFSAGSFLFLMTMALIFMKRYDVAILTGGASLLLQVATHRLWRRLRDERLAKLAERAAAVDPIETRKATESS